MTSTAAVHILCATYDGGAFIEPLIESIRAQTWQDWRLWIHDDGSSDGTRARLDARARVDQRITVLPPVDWRLGVPGAFIHLWDAVPADVPYLMFADQDDLWHPEKVARSLDAIRSHERGGAQPVLVHTDLAVVGAALEPIAPSFWAYAGLDPRPRSFRATVLHNTVTGNTVLLNRALRTQIGSIDPRASMHDWWVACGAAAFGTSVAVDAALVSYRQHGANSVGARARLGSGDRPLRMAIRGAWGRRGRVRRDLAHAARQAAALDERYGDRLPLADREFLVRFAALPSLPWWRRKWAAWSIARVPSLGVWRNLGVALRA